MRVQTSEAPLTDAAEALHAALTEMLERDGRVRLAIPGGSALAVFTEVAKRLGSARDRVCLTWVDERCVPSEDPASNRGSAHRAVGPFETELPLWLGGETPNQALARVRAGLSQVFDDALDVTLLGMGEDGHIASLFVGRDEPPGERVIHVDHSPKPPAERVTLTRQLLSTAPRAILVATGEAKRDALRRLAKGDEALPAVGLPGLVVFTDQEIER